MNKKELAKIVADRVGLSQQRVEMVLCEVQSLVVEVVNKGGEVCIKGFGKFFATTTKSRIYQNMVTRRRFFSQPKKRINLNLSKKFKFSIK